MCAIVGCTNKVSGKKKYCSDFCRTRARLKTPKQWKDAIWKMYSQYIKKRDRDRHGYVRCFTCDSKTIWNSASAHAGHFIHGYNPGTWINDRNVHVQCIGCNKFKNGARDQYAIRLVRKYGSDILEELDKAYNHPPLTWSVSALRDAYQEVQKKLAEVEQ